MNITINSDKSWNGNVATLIEEPSSMGDTVIICTHEDGDDPQTGETVRVYKADLIRAAKMLDVPFSENPST